MSIRKAFKMSAALTGLASMLVLTSLGCTTDLETPDSPETGFRVNVQALSPQDTAQFQILIRTCEGKPVTQAVAPLLPLKLPGGIPIKDSPLATDSQHPAADKYFVLDAGCYLAQAIPQDKDGKRVEECSIANSGKLFVEDGATRETVLVSQCKGAKRGGLDVISTLNRPPHVKELVFTPSKFVQCPERVRICVDAVDPDADPMRAEWKILNGPQPVTAPKVTHSRSAPGQLRECIAFIPGKGEWTLEVKVWDQLKHAGKLIDFEQYFANEGDPKDSHDELRFPLYGNGANCQPDTDVDAGPDVDTDIPDTDVPDTEADVEQDTDQPDTDTGTKECDCKQSVTLIEYQVDRKGTQITVSDLTQLQQGDKVSAKFTVDPGCDPIEVTLVAYEAAGPTFKTSFPQKLHDVATGFFGPGTHTLGPVSIPDCYFQVDFVCGPMLTDADLNSGKRYGDRKIDWHNNGTTSCQASQGCTRTRGYWSTHHEFAQNASQKIDWPAPEDEMNLICGKTWLSVSQLQGLGDAWSILAPQFVASRLNVAAGTSAPQAVVDALTEAETLLTNNCAGIPPADRDRALELKDILDHYNNGRIGPGHCP